jgi:SAM-dependent methyltransferase
MDYPFEHVGSEQRMDRQFQQKQVNQLRDYTSCFDVVDRHLQTNAGRSLLEIGSHTGEFLNLARSKGWIVKGIEPDRRVAEIAIEKFGLDITISLLRDALIPVSSVDVVVLFHVIEHFYQPLEELMEIHRIMKPGGILVIETPRFDTLWFRILKERERSVIPDHYFYFTAKTINALLIKAGIAVLQIKSVGRTLALDRLLTNVAKVVDSKSFSQFWIRVADRFQFNRTTFYLNTHDMMRVYAQKP